jgi:O-acetyl-ADP-ribose deacetylase (regulator of RNase III)
MRKRIGKAEVELVIGDITEMDTDAIVNAANSQLNHGGGVAGAIVRKGGSIIREESETWVFARGEVPVGSAAITSGGALAARYVIHAVGPRMGEGDEDKKLENATLNSLKMADKHLLKSISFPAISTGIFGYPIDRCAHVMIPGVIGYLLHGKSGLERVVFCLYDESAFQIFKDTFLEFVRE